jgi:hypothetical protein
MFAPVVASFIVTVCVVVYVPPAGEKVGVAAAFKSIVYPADATALADIPGATAIACKNSVL